MCAKQLLASFLLLLSVPCFAGVKVNIPLEHWKTDKGSSVYFVRASQIPMVDIRVVFNAGSSRDGKQFGLAALTNAMLDQGADDLNADQIAEQLENVGAKLSNDTNNDMGIISLRTLTKPDYLNRSLMVFRKLLSKPTFPKAAFKRMQRQAMVFLERQKQRPSSVGSRAFFQALYHSQAYGHPIYGNKETVKQLTTNDLKKFYDTYYVNKNADIVIVGDLTKDEAKRIANRLSNAMPDGDVAPSLPAMQAKRNGKLVKIKFPSAQTHIYLGQIGIERSNPDYFALKVANAVLGGGSVFSSRLYHEVRDQAGYVYHIGSHFDPWLAQGPFVINLQTRNKEAQNALALTKKVLKRYVKTGPTHKEINLVKNYMVNSFPLYLSSNSSLMANISRIAFYKLPLDYLKTYTSKIKKVSVKHAKNAFAKYVQPDQLITVMVGNGSANKQS